jgi:phosphoribosyl-AMP cyclohydrolase
MSAPKMGGKENLLTAEKTVAPSFMLCKTAKILMPNFSRNFGLVDVIVQNFATGQIVEANATDRLGYFRTLETGIAAYVYLAQHERWAKEMSDSNIQVVRQILIDCDGDALVYGVDCKNADACHNGSKNSFYRTFSNQHILPVPLCAENLSITETEVVKRLVKKPG